MIIEPKPEAKEHAREVIEVAILGPLSTALGQGIISGDGPFSTADADTLFRLLIIEDDCGYEKAREAWEAAYFLITGRLHDSTRFECWAEYCDLIAEPGDEDEDESDEDAEEAL